MKKVHKVGEIEKLVCTDCGKVFNLKENLTTHIRIHKTKIEGVAFSCGKCYKIFNTPALLKTHASKNHQNLQCDKCDHVQFSTLSLYRRHQKNQYKTEQAEEDMFADTDTVVDPLDNLDNAEFVIEK